MSINMGPGNDSTKAVAWPRLSAKKLSMSIFTRGDKF
jgi:hypothetical protein